jgi:hypothetical protein
MDNESKTQKPTGQPRKGRTGLSGPLMVGIFFAGLASVLMLVGLWREDNLSLHNVLLGVVLGGGTWGLVSWAIATAVLQVEEDVASRDGHDS